MASKKVHEWDLRPMFANDNDSKLIKKKRELKRESYKFINKWKNRTDYLKNPRILKKALDEYSLWRSKYDTGGEVEYYFMLRKYQEQSNPKIKAEHNLALELSKKIRNDIQFFTMRVARIPEKSQKKFLNYPGLE